jgi:hypothetical protein
VSERDIDAIRPFFNDAKLRGALSPVEIVHRQTAATHEGPAPARTSRPKLSIQTRSRE